METSVKVWLESLRKRGLGLYETMDELDMAAANDGYDGPAFYRLLCDVYADWKEEKPKRKYRPASKLSAEEWQSLQERYDHRCFYCGKRAERLTKDHVVPVSKNGEDTVENIVPACWPCNFKKRARLVEDFKEGATVKLL